MCCSESEYHMLKLKYMISVMRVRRACVLALKKH